MSEKEKKRKRISDGVEKPRKKTTGTPSKDTSKLKVVHLQADDDWMPVIASTPGLSLASNLSLQAYKKPKADNASELLLYSQDHPHLNYTAREQRDGSAESLLKHYVAVFDAAAGEVKVVEAPRVVMQRSIRTEDDETRAARAVQGLVEARIKQRQDLGMTFGTKKARKAITSLAENAISTARNGSKTELSKAQDAVIRAMAEAADTAPTKEERQADVDSGKPRPPHNEDATDPHDVYTPEILVGSEMLQNVRVKPWCEAVEKDVEVKLESAFVAHRLQPLAKNGKNFNIKKLKTLRYTYILICYYKSTKPGRDRGRKLPKDQAFSSRLQVESGVLEGIKQSFTEDGKMSKWHVDKLITTLCALSLVCDDCFTDTHDLMKDLGLTPKQISSYFGECGVKLIAPTETERTRMKVNKSEALEHRLAKVKLPLKFPLSRVIQRAKKR